MLGFIFSMAIFIASNSNMMPSDGRLGKNFTNRKELCSLKASFSGISVPFSSVFDAQMAKNVVIITKSELFGAKIGIVKQEFHEFKKHSVFDFEKTG